MHSKRVAELEAEVARVSAFLADMQSTLDAVTRERDDAKAWVAQLAEQLAALNAEVDHAERQRDEARAELAKVVGPTVLDGRRFALALEQVRTRLSEVMSRDGGPRWVEALRLLRADHELMLRGVSEALESRP